MHTETITYTAEITDTFGGEANYSWVRRAELVAPRDISNRALMRRAKAALGVTGTRGRTSEDGDVLEFRPYGWSVVLFVIPNF